MEKSQSLKFQIDDQIVHASHGQTTLEALLDAKFPVDHSCGGNGTCGTCRLIVQKKLELLPPRNEIEAELAQDRNFEPAERLSCQTNPVDGMVVYRPDFVPMKKGFE